MKKEKISKEIVDLILWPLRLRSYIQDIEEISEKELKSKNILKKIFESESLGNYDSVPEINEINKIQNQFTQSVNRVFELKKQGKIKTACEEVKKIDPLTKKMVYLLTSIERKIGKFHIKK